MLRGDCGEGLELLVRLAVARCFFANWQDMAVVNIFCVRASVRNLHARWQPTYAAKNTQGPPHDENDPTKTHKRVRAQRATNPTKAARASLEVEERSTLSAEVAEYAAELVEIVWI